MVHDCPERKIRGVAYGVAGLRNSGHGMFGGYPGAPSVMLLLEETKVNELLAGNIAPVHLPEIAGLARVLPYCNFEVKENDVLYMRVASGGGYGDPLERDPQLVRTDVVNGIISEEAARDLYGVVLIGERFEVDPAGTQELRGFIRETELKGDS